MEEKANDLLKKGIQFNDDFVQIRVKKKKSNRKCMGLAWGYIAGSNGRKN